MSANMIMFVLVVAQNVIILTCTLHAEIARALR